MEPLTIRIREETKESLEGEAAEYDVSVSEYVRRLIDKGWRYDELEERLESREERIEELERQLARRSEVEEKVDALAKRQAEPSAPFFVDWWRWYRSD
jgi:septal ring factor EnvC (AmiA/AmiB activator)